MKINIFNFKWRKKNIRINYFKIKINKISWKNTNLPEDNGYEKFKNKKLKILCYG